MLLFELEHVLAQDWFHLCITRGLKDGQYERIRSIFCRPHGNLQEITGPTRRINQSIETRTRPGSKRHSRSSGSGSAEDGSLLITLARLILYGKKDQLNQLNLDRTFLFFIQAGKGSILLQLLQLSKD